MKNFLFYLFAFWKKDYLIVYKARDGKYRVKQDMSIEDAGKIKIESFDALK